MKKINFGEKLAKTGDFIAENKKPLLYVGGALAIVIIGYSIVKKVNKGIGNIFSDNSKGASDFQPIQINNEFTTISDSVANNLSNQLYNAMNRPMNTDEDVIYSVLEKLQRKDDFLKVYNKFGIRSYIKISGAAPGWLEKALGSYYDLDLVEWLKEEVGVLNPKTNSLIKKTVLNAGLAY